jgi:hypothetical protein
VFRVAKNIKENVYQFRPTYAGEIDETKVYNTISDLETAISNKEYIYPGKIVYVLETKTYYVIDLEINGDSEFPSGIKTAWLSQLTSLSGTKDLVTTDYELSGYTNTWVYDNFIKTDIDIPAEDGFTVISKNGNIEWRQSEIKYIGDLSDTTGTEIARIELLPTEAIKFYLNVKGEYLLNEAKYSSTIAIIKTDEDIKLSDYCVLDSNDLDIIFNISLDLINSEYILTLQKSSSDFNIIESVIKVEIVNFS